MQKRKKVIVGISGGVDSSVAAWILKKQGYQVEGLFMKNWIDEDPESYCKAKQDFIDAKSICKKLNIYLHTVNFSKEYWNFVFKDFLLEYKLGRTPNPDILCNKKIKFNLFLKFAKKNLNANFIATGHYAQIKKVNTKYLLVKAKDTKKDQSYFLYTLNHKILSQILFPIGLFYKEEVRKIAKNLNFVTANKKNSTGICFIGKKKFRNFISNYIPNNPGNIVNLEGKVLGKHQGIFYYTIGQRKGLAIGGIKNYNQNPWYVVDKNISKNQLIVSQGISNINLMSIGLRSFNFSFNWKKNYLYQKKYLNCKAKTRFHQNEVSCIIKLISNNIIDVYFDKYVTSIAPGQSIVFYIKDICIGGGIIENRIPVSGV